MSDPKPYGSWKSSITAELITANEIVLARPLFSGGFLYWLEGRPLEGGRNVVVRRDPTGAVVDATPEPFSARSRVHEYDGGAWIPDGDRVFFTEDSSQRLHRVTEEGVATPITPEPPTPGSVRYADLSMTPNRDSLVAVREVHDNDDDVANDLVIVAADGSVAPRSLTSGRNFYSFPRVSANQKRFLWTSWDHPQMPWDGTDLWVSDFSSEGLSSVQHVAGGTEESVFQPVWGEDDTIYFISDRTGWWNLYAFRDGETRALFPMEAEFGEPQWVFGLSRYALIEGGRLVCVYTEDGTDHLAVVDTERNSLEDWPLPYTSIAGVASDGNRRVALIGSSPSVPSELVLLEVGSSTRTVVRQSLDMELDPGDLSQPEHIEFPSSGGHTAYAFFYPPTNKTHAGMFGEKPPLIVTSHGGPTSHATSGLKLKTQFWTSRGFAVVDVNYGGSTGYGREYRNRLRGQWGIVDLEDCVEAARHLAGNGYVDGKRMAIRGGSASGFTTLSALAFHDLFQAGASYYGVADLEALVRDTHKFESRYLDNLIGPYPERADLYRQRSPLRKAESLSAPIIFFQGLLDPVVPPSQAEEMIDALRGNGLPFAYVTFAEERHGFRQAASIRRSLEAELYFYSRVFGFEIADSVDPVTIENFD